MTMNSERLQTKTTHNSTGRVVLNALGRIQPIYYILVGILVWITLINPNFIQPQPFLTFLKRAAPLAVLAAGQFFVIVSGNFDLSVGSTITMVVLTGSLLMDAKPENTWWVMGLLVGLGLAIGLINGFVTSVLKVPSFITTLGMMLIIKGLALFFSGGAPQGYLPDNFRIFGRANLVGVFPIAVLVMIVVGSIFYLLAHRTNFGRQVFAVGDNSKTSALSGIQFHRIRILSFVISSISAIIAGILLGGFSGVSNAAGQGFDMQAIAAVVLGGANMAGGRGSLPTAMAGGITLQALFTLLNLLGLPKPFRDAVEGLIIIGSVAYGAYRNRKA